MAKVIESVSTSFDLPAFAGQWFHWTAIAECFWPGAGGRAATVNPELAPVRHLGGVYCFAWSAERPEVIGPTAPLVRYVGETSNFRRRMGQFGNSVGFWGERSNGHSAGWRWPEGQTEQTWVSFFPLGGGLHPSTLLLLSTAAGAFLAGLLPCSNFRSDPLHFAFYGVQRMAACR